VVDKEPDWATLKASTEAAATTKAAKVLVKETMIFAFF